MPICLGGGPPVEDGGILEKSNEGGKGGLEDRNKNTIINNRATKSIISRGFPLKLIKTYKLQMLTLKK